jgi:hypothetical protein
VAATGAATGAAEAAAQHTDSDSRPQVIVMLHADTAKQTVLHVKPKQLLV